MFAMAVSMPATRVLGARSREGITPPYTKSHVPAERLFPSLPASKNAQRALRAAKNYSRNSATCRETFSRLTITLNYFIKYFRIYLLILIYYVAL